MVLKWRKYNFLQCSSSFGQVPSVLVHFAIFLVFPQFLQTFQKSLFGPCAPNCVQIVCLNCTVLSLVLSPNIGHKRNCVDKRGWMLMPRYWRPATGHSLTNDLLSNEHYNITSHVTTRHQWQCHCKLSKSEHWQHWVESTVNFWKNLRRVNGNGDYIQCMQGGWGSGRWW